MKKEDRERSNRVIEVFKNSNLNQRQFSELIGVSQQLVSAVINYTKNEQLFTQRQNHKKNDLSPTRGTRHNPVRPNG